MTVQNGTQCDTGC